MWVAARRARRGLRGSRRPRDIHLAVSHFRLRIMRRKRLQSETIADSGLAAAAAAETARAHTDVDLLFLLSADLERICRATSVYSCPSTVIGSLFCDKLGELQLTRTCRLIITSLIVSRTEIISLIVFSLRVIVSVKVIFVTDRMSVTRDSPFYPFGAITMII